MLQVQFLPEAGRRRSVTPFVRSKEEYLESLPGYTQEQIDTVGLFAFKVKK